MDLFGILLPPSLPDQRAGAVSGGWLAREAWGRIYARRRGAPRHVPRGPDRGSYGVLGASILAVLVLALLERGGGTWDPWGGTVPVSPRYLGDGLVVVGAIVRAWAIHALGAFFTTVVAVQGGHRLVEDGPYRWVRHPSYTGALLSLLGFPLAVGSPLGLLLALLLLPPAFLYRIRVEEAALVGGLGESYRRYIGRTRRLLPGIY